MEWVQRFIWWFAGGYLFLLIVCAAATGMVAALVMCNRRGNDDATYWLLAIPISFYCAAAWGVWGLTFTLKKHWRLS